MAYEPVEKIEGLRKKSSGAAPVGAGLGPVASPFGTDRFDRAQIRPGGWTQGDWLSLSGAAAHRITPITGVVASDTAHLGVHGRDLARIARGEISYEAWLAER